MTEIKICGLTRLADALAAAQCGADALGFIFYPRSPRFLAPEKARELIRRLPAELVRVGVFVNEAPETVREIQEFCGLDLLQFHGDESPEDCRRFPASRLIRALSLQGEEDLPLLEQYPCRAFLLDSREGSLYGGTGRRSNWELAIRIRERFPLILAGGLNPGNVVEAVRSVLPQAVDINSGVESAPGIKDPVKIREVISAVKRIPPPGAKENATERKAELSRIFQCLRHGPQD